MTTSTTDTAKRLSDAELAEIAATLKAADGWPWNYEQRGQMVMGHSVGGCTLTPSDYRVADVRGWGHLQYLGVERGDGKAQALQDANGKLIAKAPEYISALLSHIAALTEPPSHGKVERARAAASTLYEHIKHGDEKHRAWLKEECDGKLSEPISQALTEPAQGTSVEAMREAAAKACDDVRSEVSREQRKTNPYSEGFSDGADECASRVRALPVSEDGSGK